MDTGAGGVWMRAATLFPSLPGPLGLGSALRTLGESERAAEQFDIVLDRLPRAVADFEEALAHDFEPLAVYGLGQALQRLAGQSRRAQRLQPRSLMAQPTLGFAV